MAERAMVMEELQSCAGHRMEEEEESKGTVSGAGREDRVWNFSGTLRKSERGSDGCTINSQSGGGGSYLVRAVREGDEKKLVHFLRKGLTEESRGYFAPYPYEEGDERLEEALVCSIKASLLRQSLSLILLRIACHEEDEGGRGQGEEKKGREGEMEETNRGEVVAHGFLWATHTALPELGIAVADDHQGKGIGAAMLAVLVGLARALEKDAIELTTMLGNKRAKQLYKKCRFRELGTILNPLGCDVTEAFEQRAVPLGISEEYQMVRILKEEKQQEIEQRMADKRSRAVELFGDMWRRQLASS